MVFVQNHALLGRNFFVFRTLGLFGGQSFFNNAVFAGFFQLVLVFLPSAGFLISFFQKRLAVFDGYRQIYQKEQGWALAL
jgi:hypothetical protein